MVENDLQLTAPIFNIQSYSIHDGPGIRVTVFEKGCPLKCLWCANPESNLETPQLMTYASRCTGCGLCVTACPNACIRIVEKQGAFVCETNRTLCTGCGACVSVCVNDAREISGKRMSVESVLLAVEKDRDFFEGTGGGLTVSGGECLLHPRFTTALLRNAKLRGIHTAVESCCFATQDTIDTVFSHVDLGLLDIKHMDDVQHKAFTGVSNIPILQNIKHIYHDLKKEIMIRVPVIPGYNDSEENLTATASFVANALSPDVPVQLLPYHQLGESKNDSLGNEMRLSIAVPSATQMQHLQALVASHGLTCRI